MSAIHFFTNLYASQKQIKLTKETKLWDNPFLRPKIH